MTPGGKAVTALPGLTPTLPLTVVAPVLVTVEPARTPKLCAVPRDIWATAEGLKRNAASPVIARRPMIFRLIPISLSSGTEDNFDHLVLHYRTTTLRPGLGFRGKQPNGEFTGGGSLSGISRSSRG